ncbi:uncharacterized protein K489DRAFT_376126 [Dissoconium aciculare CBS 342.82]|uniref:BTB domain-containing protein n=1 Tax=Dissoconium aciculare CBS 342.82 TaxID=1314786 RepID=A0A6J3MJN6_9PEZI|nr:uncharacterized protein K489DRAFT_376126 [Dissoconium aciculare CBS 342.82]KAF1827969.1 hypothetical protein K489DRAFT_376126 [Dissoconium aciculare CBS 342.82]
MEQGFKNDITFLVGEDQTQVLASSHVLQSVSRPFASLLGPHFREGRQSSGGGSDRTIALPDDDPAAMQIVCDIIHHRSKNVPDETPTEPDAPGRALDGQL